MALPNRLVSEVLAGSNILGLVGDAVICTDEDGRVVVFNHAAEKAFGYDSSEVVGRDICMLLPERYRAAHRKFLQNFATMPVASDHLMGEQREVWGVRKNGEEFPAEAMVSRHSQDGHNILTVVHRDISERKKVEDLKETIRRESDHRIRNLFSLVGALVEISARDAKDVAELRQSLSNRLRALARTQAILQDTHDHDAKLSAIIFSELNEYISNSGTDIAIDVPDIDLTPTAVRMLALVVHELVTNSVKYGALGAGRGYIKFTANLASDADGSTLVMRWSESRSSCEASERTEGFGTRLIRQLVHRGLRGNVAWEYTPEEFRCILEVPIGPGAGNTVAEQP